MAIKVSELQIGNYLYVHSALVQVVEIKECTFRAQADEIFPDAEDCEPIELSEEWLRRIAYEAQKYEQEGNGHDYKPGYLTYEGWDYILSEDVFIRKSVFRYKDSNGVIQEEDEGFKVMQGTPHDYHYLRNVGAIHELQNLYHALTGEELQIKEV